MVILVNKDTSMPIRPFLPETDAAFEQADIDAMSTALEAVCRVLKVDGDARTREALAIRIIELARRGERNPEKLCDQVVAEANGRSLEADPLDERR